MQPLWWCIHGAPPTPLTLFFPLPCLFLLSFSSIFCLFFLMCFHWGAINSSNKLSLCLSWASLSCQELAVMGNGPAEAPHAALPSPVTTEILLFTTNTLIKFYMACITQHSSPKKYMFPPVDFYLFIYFAQSSMPCLCISCMIITCCNISSRHYIKLCCSGLSCLGNGSTKTA